MRSRLQASRKDRHGDDQPRGAARGQGAARGFHRGAGGEPVVDDDGDPAVHRDARAPAAIRGEASIQLGPPWAVARSIASGPRPSAQHVVVDQRDAVLGDGADGQFRLIRRAELAHEQHVQRHASARATPPPRPARRRGRGEDDHVGAVGVGGEPGGQRARPRGDRRSAWSASTESRQARVAAARAWQAAAPGADDQHGARRLADHPVGHAAEQEPPQAMPVRAEHDDVGVVLLGVTHDLVGGRADHDGRRDRRRVECMGRDQRRHLLHRGVGPRLLDGSQIERRRLIRPDRRHRAGDDVQQVDMAAGFGRRERQRGVQRVRGGVAEVDRGDDRMEAGHGMHLPGGAARRVPGPPRPAVAKAARRALRRPCRPAGWKSPRRPRSISPPVTAAVHETPVSQARRRGKGCTRSRRRAARAPRLAHRKGLRHGSCPRHRAPCRSARTPALRDRLGLPGDARYAPDPRPVRPPVEPRPARCATTSCAS